MGRSRQVERGDGEDQAEGPPRAQGVGVEAAGLAGWSSPGVAGAAAGVGAGGAVGGAVRPPWRTTSSCLSQVKIYSPGYIEQCAAGPSKIKLHVAHYTGNYFVLINTPESRGALHNPPAGEHRDTSHQHLLTRAPCTTALEDTSSLVSDHTAHRTRAPTSPRSIGFCAYGIVLVRVRVRVRN